MGVGLRSLREPWLDVSNPLIGELLVSIFAWVARQEREQLVARTKAGLNRARRQGKTLGRPTVIDADQAARALAQAGSYRGCSAGAARLGGGRAPSTPSWAPRAGRRSPGVIVISGRAAAFNGRSSGAEIRVLPENSDTSRTCKVLRRSPLRPPLVEFLICQGEVGGAEGSRTLGL